MHFGCDYGAFSFRRMPMGTADGRMGAFNGIRMSSRRLTGVNEIEIVINFIALSNRFE